eukprot:TRINITY_DN36361_c0_g1_i2.p3 TRINITY_DN36361_c0_g1~~TRINITY_DN36361_c0_g1_i2.p3  ORF type:complete len:243 (+),score=54.81 TRINITY_DN36361_c0_g1_i2:466-1194(+)
MGHRSSRTCPMRQRRDAEQAALVTVPQLLKSCYCRRLWRPNAFCEHALGPARIRRIRRRVRAAADATPLVAADFGCGSGRDAVWLAAALAADDASGWRVLAVDNHTHALGRGAELERRSGLRGVAVEWAAADLRDPADLARLPRCAVAHGHRFLSRPLLAALVHGDKVLPGGAVVWSTFVGAEDDAPRNLAPPYSEQAALRPGELRAAFRDAGWLIEEDFEAALLTRGRPVPAHFVVAVRPS